MRRHQTTYILLATIAIIAVMFFGLFKRATVPANKWSSRYDIYSKDPNGLFVFYELLKKKYGEDNVVAINNRSEIVDKNKDNIYIFLDSEYYGEGGQYIEEDSENNVSRLSFLNADFEGINSSVIFLNRYISDDYGDVYGAYIGDVDHQSILLSHMNTSFVFNADTIIGDTSMRFDYHSIAIDSIDDKERILTLDTIISSNGLPIFAKIISPDSVDNVIPVYFHSSPILFSNLAAKQDFYPLHFDAVFGDLKASKVYIIKNKDSSPPTQNPLRYIFEQKPLRTAYYLLLATLLIYIVFGSKRIFRAIPIVIEKKNTSLQYIYTLARLYEYNNDNYNLVMKMKDVFYHKIQKKYFISSDDASFSQIFSKKSKVDIGTINTVQYYFKTIEEERTCSDDQLLMLNEYIKVIDRKILEN
jgi:hypothetical protein